MKSFWICAFLLASVGVYTNAQEPDEYEDYYNYDNFEDLDKKIDEEINKLNEKTDNENDLKVDEDIQQFREAGGDILDAVDEPKDTIDNIDDYQFEDNRDKPKEDENDDKKDNFDNYDGIEVNNKEPVKEPENNDYSAENRLEPDDKNAPSRNEDYALLWGDDSIAPLPVPEVPENDEIKSIVEETQKILEEKDADNFEEEIKKQIGEVDVKTDDQPNLEQIVEETKKLLAESDDSFNNDESNTLNEESEKTANVNSEKKEVDQSVKNEVSEEDTVDKVYADLHADLDKLFETLDKLKDDMSYEDNIEDVDTNLEGTDDLFKDNNDNNDDNNIEDSEELVKDIKEDDLVDLDKILEDILSEDDMKAEDVAAEIFEPLINDALNEPNPDDADEKDVESLDSKLEPILYLNDALVDEAKDVNDALVDEAKDVNDALAVEAKDIETLESNDENADANASVEKVSEVKPASIDDLTSAEMNNLISQFSILHSEDLDIHSETFAKDVTPEHVILKLDEPTIITSPGYPDPYPTENIVDWIVEGEGVGIELNITEFAVNGTVGDYLLIKPGGVDDSGYNGLLFTYRLTSERRYRFTDVDRLFMRFESKLSMTFLRGFVISAKMIAPIPEEPEPIPEPEAVVVPPHTTTTLTLSVTVPDFLDIKDQFQQLLADMAEEYIKDNAIDPGLNTTSEVTQITKIGLCPISWPDYEGCSAVTFGVSLVYDDNDDDEDEENLRLNVKDLQSMWSTYSKRDPFALRLSRMGITEFIPPGNSALTAWLVIAGGVVISMAMLAFVLWRYSCFEDYTRMKTYSDTDSIHNEKRHLDLYPTPHQTLPPLYAENEYKWHDEDSTRVDMGGYANRSYARENMYDFESDEEVVVARDRHGAVIAKDTYGSNV